MICFLYTAMNCTRGFLPVFISVFTKHVLLMTFENENYESKEFRQPPSTSNYLSFDWFRLQRCYVVSNLNRLNLRSLPFLLRKGLIFQHVTCCNTWNIQKMQRLKNSDNIPTVSKHTLLIYVLRLKQHHSRSFNCLCLSNRAKWHLQSYTFDCSLFLPTDLHIPLPYSHQQKYSGFFHHSHCFDIPSRVRPETGLRVQ